MTLLADQMHKITATDGQGNILFTKDVPPTGAVYGAVGRGQIGSMSPYKAVLSALRDYTMALVEHIAVKGRPLTDSEMSNLQVYFVQPGSHGDPLAQELLLGWKYQADYDGPTD